MNWNPATRFNGFTGDRMTVACGLLGFVTPAVVFLNQGNGAFSYGQLGSGVKLVLGYDKGRTMAPLSDRKC